MSALYHDENKRKQGLREVEWDMEKKHREQNKSGGLSR